MWIFSFKTVYTTRDFLRKNSNSKSSQSSWTHFKDVHYQYACYGKYAFKLGQSR